MKTKMKTWTRVLLVCMTMSLFCVNVHSADDKKASDKKASDKEVKKECRTTMDNIELNILLVNKPLK